MGDYSFLSSPPRLLSGRRAPTPPRAEAPACDRFVPQRHGTFDAATSFELHGISARSRESRGKDSQNQPLPSSPYERALHTEILGATSPSGTLGSHPAGRHSSRVFEYVRQSPPTMAHLSSPSSGHPAHPIGAATPSGAMGHGGNAAPTSPTSLRYPSALEEQTQRLLSAQSPPPRRRVAKTPYRMLRTPELADDFYLNLVDWSAQNLVAVGLGAAVWVWDALTSSATKLCELEDGQGQVSSVCWSARGNTLAVGSTSGKIQLWDVGAQAKSPLRVLSGHDSRVGVLSWCPGLLATGSRDRTVYLRDPRSRFDWCSKLAGHKQEVCGLRWSPTAKHLASGGNDNKLFVWDVAASQREPVCKYLEHKAAVKAISWSPHQRGLLTSGGGTADRCIRFWNTLAPSKGSLHCVDTGSQVCNIRWSPHALELVSSHGYSQNQIVVWSYPSMQPLATLTGHITRVLYMGLSPDGQSICTAAGDETLRFWSVFPDRHPKSKSRLEMLSLR